MCLEHCLIFIINIFNVPLALVNDSFWHVLGKSNILIRHSHDSQAGVQNTKKGLNARGMVMSSFLDKGGYYSGTWSPIFMKFCMVGTFWCTLRECWVFGHLTSMEAVLEYHPFSWKKVYETYLCTKTTHCVKLEPQKMQWPLSNG